MTFQSQVSRMLDDEHRLNLELLGRVEQAFARVRQSGAAHDSELTTLVATFARHIEQEVWRHFDFEERELFPRLVDAGDGDMASLLLEEHEAIRAVAGELLPLARAAPAGTLDDNGLAALKRSTLEMSERLIAHIHKETMALLPMLDDLLDEGSDHELALAYAAG